MFERARFLGISARRLALAAVDPFRPGKAHGNARPRAAS
jgi:hypothetical protein